LVRDDNNWYREKYYLFSETYCCFILFITIAIAWGSTLNFARTRHLLLEFILIFDSLLAGELDYNLAFITDIIYDFSLNVFCARTLNKLGILNISDNLVGKLKAIEVKISGNSQIPEVEDIETFGFLIWLEVLGINPDMLNLTSSEVQAINDYLYTNTLIVRCKEVAIQVSL
jgi:hypothetical protein